MGNADHLMPLGDWLSHKEVTVEEDEEEDEEEDGEEDAHANIRNGIMGAPCCIIKKGIHYGKK